MEKSIDELKKMVFDTLLESKKPLMAKKIAFNIYRKYDGYKMSRFMVRDILWKEMKGQFEYDKETYTYWINKNQISGFEFNENETLNLFNSITEEAKNNETVKLRYSPINPYLFPFAYNIQTKLKIRLSIENWQKKIISKAIVSNNELNSFHNACKAIKDHTDCETDWILIFNLIKKYKIDIEEFSDSVNYKFLKEYLSNPFHYIMILLEFKKERNAVLFNNDKFQSLFDEIARDNKITKNEQNYLLSKAEEYGIEKPNILDAIETIDFKGYGSFKRLVDEICEDGIITDVENDYINEKAEDYNVPPGQLQRMIDAGLLKVKIINQYKNEISFYQYVKSIFILKAFNIEFDINIFENSIDNKELFIKTLEHNTDQNLKIILTKINDVFEYKLKCKSIDELIKSLDLKPISLNHALEIHDRVNKNFVVSSFEDLNEKLTDYWKVIFDNTISAAIEFDYMNKKVIMTNHDNKNDSEIFIEFITKLFEERNNHRSPEIDLFFENFEDFYNTN